MIWLKSLFLYGCFIQRIFSLFYLNLVGKRYGYLFRCTKT